MAYCSAAKSTSNNYTKENVLFNAQKEEKNLAFLLFITPRTCSDGITSVCLYECVCVCVKSTKSKKKIEKKEPNNRYSTDTKIVFFCSNDYQAAKVRASEYTWFVWKYALNSTHTHTHPYKDRQTRRKYRKRKEKKRIFFENCSKIKRNENFHANTCIN